MYEINDGDLDQENGRLEVKLQISTTQKSLSYYI